ncbi:MAG TPA: GAF domain-containing SpoIIE family protein phosphatase [Tepidisphaeraceae bacterium]
MQVPQSISLEQMTQVLDVTRLLTVTADLDLLLRRIAESACGMLDCERASIFLYDAVNDQLWTKIALQSKEIRVPANAGIVGHAFKTNSLVHVAKPYEDARFNPEPDRRSGFVTRNLLTAPMLDLEGRPVGVIQAVNKKNDSYHATDETMLQLLAAQAGVAIQRYNLQQAAVEAMALRREMDLAKTVQEKLMPHAAPKIPGLLAAGWAKTASITGGDCYDLWKTTDGRLGIFLGDATGHGIGPAMVVSQTRTLIRAMCDVHASPRDLLACANTRLSDDLDAGSFVTAFCGFLSPDGVLEWCSAGHGPILLRRNGDAKLEELNPSQPPLGVIPDFSDEKMEQICIKDHGMLCVSSDGIFESFSPDNELFGVERAVQILDDAKNVSPAEMIERMHAAVQKWQGNDEPRDDQTLVIAVPS